MEETPGGYAILSQLVETPRVVHYVNNSEFCVNFAWAVHAIAVKQLK